MNAEAKFVSSVMDARLKKVKRECDSFRKQRDELINDMAEVKRKAEAFDEILNCPGGSAMDVAYYVDKIVDEYYKESEE